MLLWVKYHTPVAEIMALYSKNVLIYWIGGTSVESDMYCNINIYWCIDIKHSMQQTQCNAYTHFISVYIRDINTYVNKSNIHNSISFDFIQIVTERSLQRFAHDTIVVACAKPYMTITYLIARGRNRSKWTVHRACITSVIVYEIYPWSHSNIVQRCGRPFRVYVWCLSRWAILYEV